MKPVLPILVLLIANLANGEAGLHVVKLANQEVEIYQQKQEKRQFFNNHNMGEKRMIEISRHYCLEH